MRDLESFPNILVKECPLQLEQWSGLYFVNGIFFGKVVVLGRTLNFWAWFLIFLYFASCPPTFLEAVPYQEGHCGLTYFPSLFLGKPISNPLVFDLFSDVPHQGMMLSFWVHVLCVSSPLVTCCYLLFPM